MQQTSVQNSDTIRFGSGKVEVGPDTGSLVNLGAMNGVTFEESWEDVEIKADNAGIIYKGKEDQRAAISGELYEVNLTNLDKIRGGLDSYSTEDGSQVTGATQTVTSGNWDYDKFIKIENQNADGSKITVNSVSGSSDGTLTEDTDYIVMENNLGDWGIIIDSENTNVSTTSQDLTIDYDYTPAAAKILSSGGNVEIEPKVVRITNTDQDGNIFEITIYKAYNQSGISLEFQPDDSGEPATQEIELEGVEDESRSKGDQLFKIRDEQNVT